MSDASTAPASAAGTTRPATTAAPRFRTLRIGDADRERLRRGLLPLAYPHGPDHEPFLDAARAAVARLLPPEARALLAEVRSSPEPPGVVLIQNLPVDDLPDTPSDGRRSPHKRTHVSEAVTLGVAALLGEPLTFGVEKGDDLVHDVCPVRGAETELTNRGSSVDLGFHTERAALDTDRFLLLFCNRPDHDREARTPVADVRDALPLLDPAVVAELRKPNFRFRVPYIFDADVPPESRYSAPAPVVSGPPSRPAVRVALYGDVTRAETPEAAAGLGQLRRAFDLVARDLRLDSGDLAVVGNRLAVHGRSSFTPRFDGRDRWLQRVHVAESLWPFRSWQKDAVRVLTLSAGPDGHPAP